MSKLISARRNPRTPILLIRAKNGVILAFRGTLTLPISPGKARHNGLVKEAIDNFNVAVLKAFESYLRDWANNVVAFADERDRHAGFDHSWQELKEHLKIDCGPGAAEACSKFRSFITAMGASDQQLFLTGHSKGGALATLASLDMPEFFEHAPQTTVYTFAAPKSLSQEGAANAANATADLWRFEDERDVVPTLPMDSTGFPVTLDVPLTEWKMAPYAHVGRRVLFRENEKPAIFPEPVNGLDPPGDLKRLKAILRGGAEPAANNSIEEKGLLRRILSAGADGCRRFLDTHFSVFSSVQAMTRAGERRSRDRAGKRKPPKRASSFLESPTQREKSSGDMASGAACCIRRSETGLPHLVAIHWHQEFDRVVERRTWRQDVATDLQVPPVQRALDPVENKGDAPFRSLDAHLHEALKEGRAVEIEDAGERLDTDGPGVEPCDPTPERLLPQRHLRLHLRAKLVCARIEGPVGNVWLFRKVEGRADAEVSAAAAIDKVVHRARRAVAADFFFVILEVMGVAGHGDFHIAARQEAIERGKVA